MFDLAAVQSALQSLRVAGWLLYDFRGSNPLARRIVGFPEELTASRRWFYWVPAAGQPRKLVHRIEDGVLDHLPGERTIYLRWQELEAGVQSMVAGAASVAMEYSPRNGNPYVARVDAGTIELVRSCGPEVVSSGDLVQIFEAAWDEVQWELHRQAEQVTTSAFHVAWKLIAEVVRSEGGIEETTVQDAIMRHFDAHQCLTYHPPIVARAEHSGLPHYETGHGSDCRIREGDLVLIDQWCKLDRPRAVYSDLTRMGFVGERVPEPYAGVFAIVARARDAAIAFIGGELAAGRDVRGWQVDDAARHVIEQAGYGPQFVHRTGHSIGAEVHGNGANMDNLETRDERRLVPRTCFSIEPGIYLPEFGIRSEINVFLDAALHPHVTGGPPQTAIVPILGEY